MPKKIYVQAKKEIEALMYENIDCVAKFGIYDWSDVWDSSFETKNILEEGKVIDFTYSEKALSLQAVLNDAIEKALEVAKANNTPEFFDYLLGEVKIAGDFKTYTEKHVQTEKKYFNVSQKSKKKYYTSKLLLSLVNIAPEGSQAASLRNTTKELTVLSFAGVHRGTNGVHSCVFDFKNINNFKFLEKLEIYCPSDILNSEELTKLTHLSDFGIEGSKLANTGMYNDTRIVKNQLFINEDFPGHPNLSSLKIYNTTNSDLTFLKKIKGFSKINILQCKNISNLVGLNVKETRELAILGCDQLSDISLLKEGVKIEDLNLTLNSTNISLSGLEELRACKRMQLGFSKEVDISFIESLDSIEELTIGGGDFSKVKDLSRLKKMKNLSISATSLTVFPELGDNLNLKGLTIEAPNLNQLSGMSDCINLKKILLRNMKNLRSIKNFPKLKIVDFHSGRGCGLESLDFLENTQIISKYNHTLGYNKELGIREGGFSVSHDRSDEDKKKTGKGFPDGFDSNGYVIPEFFEDGSSTDFLWDNALDLKGYENLENINGLRNVTNIMAIDLGNCVKLKSLDGLEKMLDLREIDLTGGTILESLHALKHCSKLEKIITLECDHISPKPKVKKMNTLEKVQDYLKRL